MSVNKYIIQLVVETGSGEAKVRGVSKAFKDLETTANRAAPALQKAKKATDGMGGAAGIAGATAAELGRTISDLPYGLQAVTNNISQLGSMFALLVSSSNGVGAAINNVGKVLAGPAGVLLLFQGVVAAVDMLSKAFNKNAREAKKEKDELRELNSTLMEQQMIFNELSNIGFEYSSDISALFAKNLKEVGSYLSELEKEGPITEQIYDAAIQKGNELLSARIKQNEAQKELVKQQEELNRLEKEEPYNKKAIQTATMRLGQARLDLKDSIDAENAALKFLNYQATEEVEIVEKVKEKREEEIDVLKTLGTTYQRTAEFKRMMNAIGFDYDIPSEQLKNSAEKATDEFQKYAAARAAGRETEEENKLFLSLFGLTKENFQYALESASELTGLVNDIFQSEADRAIDIEKNKTIALNDQLKERLSNEQLSADERDKINQQISRNEAELVRRENEINKQRFNQEKAFSIAQATINTYLAASDVLAKEKGGLAAKIIGMTVVIASGLAQVAAIARQQFVGQAMPSPNLTSQGVGASETQGPAFNVVGAAGQNQLAAAIAGQMQQPVKAYVVSSDVTTAQELDRRIVQGASI